MAAKPKLTPEEWAAVRARWEADAREGYAWLILEMGLDLSGPAVRKAALSQGWTKTAGEALPQKALPAAKVSRRPKVSENHAPETLDANLRNLAAAQDHARHRAAEQPSAVAQLSERERIFVREYLTDMNATRAAIAAGYSEKSAASIASENLRKPKIQAAIAELQAGRVERLEVDADERVRRLKDLAELDANDFTQYIRHCCPHCWGIGHARQYTPAAYQEAKKEHEMQRAGIMAQGGEDIGPFPSVEGDWWDQRKDPNPECPECFGHGMGKMIIRDTRTLPPAALAAFEGVKKTRDGIEVLTFGKAKAEDMLLRSIGAYRDKDLEVNVTVVDVGELAQMFADRMAAARARQAAVLQERGIVLEAEGD